MERYHIAGPRRLMPVALIAFILVALAACSTYTDPAGGTTGSGTTTATGTSGGTPAPCASACSAGAGIQAATLAVEPTVGDTPEVQAIQGAKKSVWLEIYLLTEHNVINELENAANRGVDVRVMLEAHPDGSGTTTPQQTIDELNAAGVHAQTANEQAFALTHAKIMIIDGQTAYISSGNFTKSALGGSSYTSDRDYLITDTNSADVQECSAIFTADWNRTTPQLNDPNLVVSPVNSRADLTALINSAKQSLHLEEEEMQDPQMIQALISAAGRGVQVEVVVPVPGSNSSDAQGEQQLTQGGVKVVTVDDSNGGLYIHAKIIIADGTEAFVGSENFSTYSLDKNREVGVLIANTQVIQQLEATFEQDFTGGPAGS
jgi:cardiolipin synthase